jgi:hypothetical protein
MQHRWHPRDARTSASLFTQGKYSRLDDKLKLVGHCRMFDMRSLEVVVRRCGAFPHWAAAEPQ